MESNLFKNLLKINAIISLIVVTSTLLLLSMYELYFIVIPLSIFIYFIFKQIFKKINITKENKLNIYSKVFIILTLVLLIGISYKFFEGEVIPNMKSPLGYKVMYSDKISYEDKVGYYNLTDDDKYMIKNIIIPSIKEGYLDNINKITFMRTPINEVLIGVWLPLKKEILIQVNYNTPLCYEILNTLCHETLHSSGMMHFPMLYSLSEDLTCFNKEELQFKIKEYRKQNIEAFC